MQFFICVLACLFLIIFFIDFVLVCFFWGGGGEGGGGGWGGGLLHISPVDILYNQELTLMLFLILLEPAVYWIIFQMPMQPKN